MVRVLAAALLLTMPVTSTMAAVPVATQASLLKKVLDYDRAQPQRKGAYIVLIIHKDATPAVQEITAEFRKLGMAAILAPLAQLPTLVNRAAAAYVMPEVATEDVLKSCADHKVLTFHGGHELVQQGLVSMGLIEANGRTDVVVHLGRMKIEGHPLPASVLQVTRVIR